jgi:hypothetical protein
MITFKKPDLFDVRSHFVQQSLLLPVVGVGSPLEIGLQQPQLISVQTLEELHFAISFMGA